MTSRPPQSTFKSQRGVATFRLRVQSRTAARVGSVCGETLRCGYIERLSSTPWGACSNTVSFELVASGTYCRLSIRNLRSIGSPEAYLNKLKGCRLSADYRLPTMNVCAAYVLVTFCPIRARIWSHRRDLNSRPAHYRCAALPTELQWQIFKKIYGDRIAAVLGV
jgi:hypothetical protein